MNKTMKNAVSIIMIVMMMLGTTTLFYNEHSYADEPVNDDIKYGPDGEVVVDEGDCGAEGDNATWTLDDQGVLRIRGTGRMRDYDMEGEDHPWDGGMVNKVIISKGIISIGDEAFFCCDIDDISIPDSVKEIGVWAISSCEMLEKVNIPDSVTVIKYSAFEDCDKLSEIRFSKKLKTVGEKAFDNTKWIKNQAKGGIYTGSVLYKWKGKVPSSVTIKKGTITIREGVFECKHKLRKVKLPNSLNYIEQDAFDGCDLRSLKLPKKLKYIGAFAFSSNYKLKKLTIPKSVKEIDVEAFDSCGLKKVKILNKSIKIGSSVFGANPITNSKGEGPICIGKILVDYNGPYKKKSVKIKAGITSIAPEIFSDCKITSLTIPKSTKVINGGLFNSCPYVKKITVHKKNKYYDSRNNCNAIIETKSNKLIVGCNKTKIPKSVTSIGEAAFSSSGLKKIVIPGSVRVIEQQAFKYCYNLKSVKIGKGTKIIGVEAFDSGSLKSVTIPASVTEIGDKAFGYQDNINYQKKTKGFKIYGTPGTAAEQYAKKNKFEFISVA